MFLWIRLLGIEDSWPVVQKAMQENVRISRLHESWCLTLWCMSPSLFYRSWYRLLIVDCWLLHVDCWLFTKCLCALLQVAAVPGGLFAVEMSDPPAPSPYLRLCFSIVGRDKMDRGLAALARIIREHQTATAAAAHRSANWGRCYFAPSRSLDSLWWSRSLCRINAFLHIFQFVFNSFDACFRIRVPNWRSLSCVCVCVCVCVFAVYSLSKPI